MDNLKGTKGKWKAHDFKVFDYSAYVINDKNTTVCTISLDDYETIIEAQANVTLISKTPEMLEMLIDIVEQENISQCAHDKINQLIHAATNKTN